MRFEPDWQRLLPGEPYRFHMGIRPGDARRFFAPTSEHEALVAERTRWLQASPGTYCQLRAEGYPLLEETIQLARQWGLAGGPESPSSVAGISEDAAEARCLALGRAWEPDFLLLSPSGDGVFRLAGGVVCFPSAWSLPEKMGGTVAEIHGVVPLLNQELGRQIDVFLGRTAPGSAWERANWGLSRGADLNRHPSRNLPELEEDTSLDHVFVRVEHQIFFRLPRTFGILFGIRLSLHRLEELMVHPTAVGLRQALESMPELVAQYKGVHRIRSRLIRRLSGSERITNIS